LTQFRSNGEVVSFRWEIFECVSRPHIASSNRAKDEATAIANAREKARELSLGNDLPIEWGPDGFWLYNQYDVAS
jgi:hypothetical protein